MAEERIPEESGDSEEVDAHGFGNPRPSPGWEGEESKTDEDVEAHGFGAPRPNPGWEGEEA